MNPIEMLNPIVLSVLAREEFASRINALLLVKHIRHWS